MDTNPSFSVQGKVTLITGSGRGIGRALALGFGEAGANVVVNSVSNPQQGQSVVTHLNRLGFEATYIQADVSERPQAEHLITETLSKFGRIDVLINNAGIVGGAPAESLDMAVWNKVLGVNLTGLYMCCGLAAEMAMIPQGQGRIINISSISAEIGHPAGAQSPVVGLQQAAYHASKGAVNVLSRALALEWVSHGITVNTISPGWIDTGIDDEWFADDPKNKEIVLQDTPMRRLGRPEELVGPAIFLASDAASFVTGHNLVVDGGYTIW
jgi:NAD(P)-dependent dehydrogenase (short-subunit alcohol dehydrogenase family)